MCTDPTLYETPSLPRICPPYHSNALEHGSIWWVTEKRKVLIPQDTTTATIIIIIYIIIIESTR
jgi:hypothetical protein